MIKILLIFTLMISSHLMAQNVKNKDGSDYKAPRLAGDSLSIKPLKKFTNEEDVNSISDMFEQGSIKGLIRYSAQFRDTSYHSTQSGVHPHSNNLQQYSALGGYLGYETAQYKNFSLGTTVYTAQKFGPNPDNRIGLGGLTEDGGTANSYAVLGEAYLKYKTQNHDIRVGRREMPDYRFISLSNIRFSPFTHEGVTYETNLHESVKLTLGYITRQKDRNAVDFKDMVRSARVNQSNIEGNYDASNYTGGIYSGSDKAMSMLSLAFTQESLHLELWNYYVTDFVNTLYLYGDYNYQVSKDMTLTAAFQYGKQNNVGGHVAGNIDTYFYGIKAQASLKSGITLFGAYNEIAYNENSYAGGTIFVRWGTPQMFNSYQVQDSELAGTRSIGIGAQFELGHMGIIPNTVIRFRHGHYDMPDSLNDRYAAQDRSESTFDFRYSFDKNDGFGIFTEMKGLSVQFRVAYNDYKTDYDYESYKLIHGVSFDDVVKDFVDTRLYIDYIF